LKHLNKYLIIILAIVVVVIFAVNLGNNGGISAKHFDNGEISFDYPGTLNEINGTGAKIALFSDDSGSNITVIKHSLPPGYNLADHTQLNGIGDIDKSFQLVSKRNVTVDGTSGYESYYNIDNGSKQRKEVWVEKNNAIYGIIYTGPGKVDTDNSGLNLNVMGNSGDMFNTIVNSIKINDTESNPSQYTGWAELIMPSIGGDWSVTSDSVNDPAVYHIAGSYYPGENGQMALLGHHTTHAAPFVNINQLKSGDPLIIKDYITQKKYTYKVVSNGDVRWGVKGVSIDYQPTDAPELWLVTCWPPGYSRASWIVHSKLVSVEPLG